jgi:hypothetical protein
LSTLELSARLAFAKWQASPTHFWSSNMNKQAFALRTIPMLLGLTLAACGGGGGGGNVAPQALTLSGTAAVGAAIALAPVEVKCASGTGSATSRADGAFDVTVSGGRLPCVLRVTTSDGTVLHSVAIGTGNSVRANISPLTDLAVAHLAGTAPSTLWDTVAVERLTEANLTQAVATVFAAIGAAGIDTVNIGNPFSAALLPPSGTTPGNAYDQALDALQAALVAAGLELSNLRDSVIASAPTAAPSPNSAVPSLPSELLLAPKAATCASLASGRYRILGFGNGDFADTATLNATSLELRQVFDDGSPPETTQLTAVANQPCEFTAGEARFLVGAAGVALISFVADEGSSRRMALMFPEQSHSLASLQGAWLLMWTEAEGNNLRGSRGALTLNASGALIAASTCDDFGPCQIADGSALGQFTVVSRPDGGFNAIDTEGSAPLTGRVFGYRSGGGQLNLIGIAEDGGWQFYTRTRTLPLPSVGNVSSGGGINISTSGQVAGPLAPFSSTVVSVNAGTTPPTFNRENVFNFTTGATVPETLQRNSPADGFQRRLPATGVIASDGSTRNVSEWIGMPLAGTGLTPLWLPGSSTFNMSLNRATAQ